MARLSLLFAFLFAICSPTFASTHYSTPPMRNGNPVVPCFTEELFDLRNQVENAAQAECATRGSCDNVEYRDDTSNSGGNSVILISTAVHLMQGQFGQAPNGTTTSEVEKLMDRMNTAFGSYGIGFNTTIYEHRDPEYYCIPAYSSSNSDWATAIDEMKKQYAVDVGQTLNIFISCQGQKIFGGTLFGIGTFPWDTTAALQATGGLWLNSISTNTAAQLDGDITAEHEMGHCLGLWHTFHGTDEVLGCNLPCEEEPHSVTDAAANKVGDFCSDTPATPRNYACENPNTDACDGTPYGETDYTNYMGYGMDPKPCGNHFTDQQQLRMRCWICDALKGFVMPDANGNLPC